MRAGYLVKKVLEAERKNADPDRRDSGIWGRGFGRLEQASALVLFTGCVDAADC
jgi:hypothetical protein